MHTTGADLTVQPVISVGSRRGDNGPACIFVHSRADQTATTANDGSITGCNILQHGDPLQGNDRKKVPMAKNQHATTKELLEAVHKLNQGRFLLTYISSNSLFTDVPTIRR